MAPPETFRYDRVKGCTGGPTQSTMEFYRYILRRWNARGMGVYNCRNVRGGSSLSEHSEGRAMDLGYLARIAEEKVVADHLCDIFVRHHAELGIQSIVWNGRVWGYARGKKWRNLSSRAHPHHDHIHVGLNWWGARNLTGKAVASVLDPYLQDEDDEMAQRWMIRIEPTESTPPGRTAGYYCEVGKPVRPIDGAPKLDFFLGHVAVVDGPVIWTEHDGQLLQYDLRHVPEIKLISEERTHVVVGLSEADLAKVTESMKRAQVRFEGTGRFE